MRADSRADIGHFWDLGQGRDGAELVSLTEIGIESLKNDDELCRKRSSCISCRSALERGELRSEEKGKKSIHSMVVKKTLN